MEPLWGWNCRTCRQVAHSLYNTEAEANRAWRAHLNEACPGAWQRCDSRFDTVFEGVTQCERAQGHEGGHYTKGLIDKWDTWTWTDDHAVYEPQGPPIRTNGTMPRRGPTKAITS